MKALVILEKLLIVLFTLIMPNYLFAADECSPSDFTYIMNVSNTTDTHTSVSMIIGSSISYHIQTGSAGTLTIETDNSNNKIDLNGAENSCPPAADSQVDSLSYTDTSAFDVNIVVYASGDTTHDLTITFSPSVIESPPIMDDVPNHSTTNGLTYLLDISDYVTQTDGDSITYTLTGTVPTGLSFDTATGILDGTPTVDGIYNLSAIATDNDGDSNSDSFTLTVASIQSEPIMGDVPNQVATNGSAFSLDISTYVTLTDGDAITSYTFLTGTPPTGLDFNTTTGILSGTPTVDGTTTFEVIATDDDGNSDPDTFTLTVSSTQSPPIMGDVPDQTATNGSAFSLYISTYVQPTDGDAITSYTFLTGTPPTGLDFNTTTGILSGTPTVDGTTNFSVIATDDDGDSNSDSFTLTVSTSTTPPAQDEYACGVFSSVLTSYDSIYSGYGHPANSDQACYTGSISYPEGGMTGEITCNPDGCGGTTSCERVDPPSNKLDYSWDESDLLGTAETVTSGSTLTNYEYGDISGDLDITLDPGTTNDLGTPVMVLGDVVLEADSELSLEPGDYFFNSLTFSGNNPEVILPSGGEVRIFIQNNFEVTGNGLNINQSGSQNDLFIYVKGDMDFYTNGNIEVMKGYFYVEGTVLFDANSANFEIYGGVTAEGPILIGGNNGEFYQQGDSGGIGYGDCVLCFEKPVDSVGQVSTRILNLGNEFMSNLVLSKAYDYSGYTITDHSTTTGSSATSNSITVDFDGYANFPNPTTASGFVYTIGDYLATQADTLTDTTSITFNLDDYNLTNDSSVRSLFIADYTDVDRNYHVIVDMCWQGGATTFMTGPFDAWDIFRDDAVSPPSDRNISTKVVNKAFQLSLASLNETFDAYETKDANNSYVDIAIYPNEPSAATLPSPISNTIQFDANSTAHVATSSNLTVTTAVSDAIVGLKVCATYEDDLYYLHPTSSCAGAMLQDCDGVTTGTPTWHLCRASDNLSIRPDRFLITPPSGLLKSAADHNFTVIATQDGTTTAAAGYNITGAQSILDINRSAIYESPLNVTTLDNTLNGAATFSAGTFNIVEGSVSDAGMTFDDVGKVTITLKDTIWSLVDIDDTPQTCDDNTAFGAYTIPNGTYVCGDVNATFIPDHFALSSVSLNNKNNSDGNFTYLSNDLNMSASLAVTVTAKNALAGITKNFKSGSWENPVDISFTVATINTPLINIDDINETLNLGFGLNGDANGTITIPWSETNSSKKLRFNYNRDKNNTLNPFLVDGSDVNLTATSVYTGPIVIEGSSIADQNATFIYGRTHASRQRYYIPVGTAPIGTANIYFEAFCFGIDSNNITCTKSLLPNGDKSISVSNTKWSINYLHGSESGSVGAVVEEDFLGRVTEIGEAVTPPPNAKTVKTLEYKYNGTNYDDNIYTYTTTMENSAPLWLIYNEDNPAAVTNQFTVDFIKETTGWSGEQDTDTTTKDANVTNTNRRTTW